MTIITTHINADFDALAASISASKLYKDSFVVLSSLQDGVKEFLEENLSSFPQIKKQKDIDFDKIEKLVVVDCQQSARIGKFSEIIDKVLVDVYDHHMEGGDLTGNLVVLPYGSTSTIIAEILMKNSVEITPIEATTILLGIHEDTGNLMFNTTTAVDYAVCSWLLQKGADLSVVSKYLTFKLTTAQLELINNFLRNLKTKEINGISISVSYIDVDEYISDIAVIANIIMNMKGLNNLTLVAKMSSTIFVIMRSNEKKFNANAIIRHLGGGGHATAASATIKNRELIDVIEDLENFIQLETTKPMTVEEIMSTPVRVYI